jgi:hypothetical protein
VSYISEASFVAASDWLDPWIVKSTTKSTAFVNASTLRIARVGRSNPPLVTTPRLGIGSCLFHRFFYLLQNPSVVSERDLCVDSTSKRHGYAGVDVLIATFFLSVS